MWAAFMPGKHLQMRPPLPALQHLRQSEKQELHWEGHPTPPTHHPRHPDTRAISTLQSNANLLPPPSCVAPLLLESAFLHVPFVTPVQLGVAARTGSWDLNQICRDAKSMPLRDTPGRNRLSPGILSEPQMGTLGPTRSRAGSEKDSALLILSPLPREGPERQLQNFPDTDRARYLVPVTKESTPASPGPTRQQREEKATGNHHGGEDATSPTWPLVPTVALRGSRRLTGRGLSGHWY